MSDAPPKRPRGLTPKQEAFALAYLETSNATEAYRRAYEVKSMSENALNVEAHRVLNNPKVALRLQVLQSRVASKAVLSRSWIIEQLMDNAAKAKAASDFTASNKAIELLGKTDEAGGMWIERTNATNTTTVKAESVPALAAFVAALVGDGKEEPASGTVPN